MANRYLYQFRGSFEPGIVTIYGKISFGATGAPTLVSGQNRGISTIVRNSAGNYTITLMDSYVRTLGVSHNYLESTAPAAPALFMTADNVATLATPTIIVVTNAAGTATDPANGDVMMIRIDLKNSSS